MSSCKNATPAAPKGVLRPAETLRLAGLRRDHPVSPALRPFVELYWSVSWDLRGRPPFRTEVLSHPAVNVSVESGDSPRFGVALPAVIVHGVVTRRFCVDLTGWGRVSAARFRPGGFAALCGVAPPRGTVTPLAGELGIEAAALAAEVLAHESDEARCAVLDAVLLPRAPEPPAAYLHLQALVEQMKSDRTLLRVEDVAVRGSLSVRALQRLFTSYVGVAPKAVLARYRLQDAVAAIDAGQVTDLATLAASLGWFDQAHFSRDFRAVVGTTPSAYLQRARRSPQHAPSPERSKSS